MKHKLIIFPSLFLILFSCKRTRTCECWNKETSDYEVIKVGKTTVKEIEEACSSFEETEKWGQCQPYPVPYNK